MIAIRYWKMVETLRRLRVERHVYLSAGWRVDSPRPRIKELTRRAIAKRSGISEKTLTQIARNPGKDLSFVTVNKLVHYFYREFLETPPHEFKIERGYIDQAKLFEWVVTNLIEILPDEKESQEFWDTLSQSKESWINRDRQGRICPEEPLAFERADGISMPFKTDLLKEHGRLEKEKRARRTSKS